jgi:PTS system cellobiose-specific IIB component
MESAFRFVPWWLYSSHQLTGVVMKKIMLCCSAGMSTSLLVKKMVEEAKSVEWKQSRPLAWPNLPNRLATTRWITGPTGQVHAERSAKPDKYGIRVEPINMMDYGMQKGGRARFRTHPDR